MSDLNQGRAHGLNVYLVNDSLTQNNWGCRATTHAMHGMVEETGAHISGTLKLARLEGGGFRPGEMPGTRDLLKQWLQRYPEARARIRKLSGRAKATLSKGSGTPTTQAGFEALAADVDAGRRFADIAAEMRAADVVMINGEGTIYGNQRKGFYSLFWAWYAKTRLGRSTAIVNHTLQLDDPDMRTMAGIVYPLLDDVVFREPTSYREGCQLAAYGEQHLAADAAFCWQPVTGDEFVERYRRKGAFDIWPWSMKTFRADRPYVCVTGSSALMRPDQAGRLPVAAFRELCLDLGRRFEQVVVVAPDTTDEMLLAPVARDLDLPFIPACTPTPLGLDLLANATVFVSGRWHPSILASTGGTPSVIFSGNSHKMQGLCELLDLPYPAIDATRIGDHVGQLAQMAEDLAGEACGRRNRVLEKAKEAARKSRRNVELLLG